MQLISHCDAIIFDLRQNHGGEVETLQLYVSYFVKPEPKLYDSFYYRAIRRNPAVLDDALRARKPDAGCSSYTS